jgi:hypothetical protein
MTPEEQKLNALRFELSCRVDAARVAQNALMAEQRRQKLPIAQEVFTYDEMIAERAAVSARWVADMPGIISATLAQVCPDRFKTEFSPLGRPRTAHEKYIDQLGLKLFQADQIIRVAAEDQAVRAKAEAAPTAGNVVRMASAREIIEAGRKRRGGV